MSVSNVPELTMRVCVPRAVFIQYPFGRILGMAGDRAGQRRICDDLLDLLATATGPNQYRHLPYEWPEAAEETRWRPAVPPPLGQHVEARGLNLPETLVAALTSENPAS